MAQLRKTLWLRDVLKDEKNSYRQAFGKKKVEKAVLSIYFRGDLLHLFICLFIYLFDLYCWV